MIRVLVKIRKRPRPGSSPDDHRSPSGKIVHKN